MRETVPSRCGVINRSVINYGIINYGVTNCNAMISPAGQPAPVFGTLPAKW